MSKAKKQSKAKTPTVFVIQNTYKTRSYFQKQTSIGPMFTTKLSEAARFQEKMDALPVLQSHSFAFAFCEVVEVPA